MPSKPQIYEINEDLKIPVKLAWICGVALVTIAMSFATVLVKQDNVQARVASLDSQISEMEKERSGTRDKLGEAINRVDRRLSRIEGRLQIQQGDDR